MALKFTASDWNAYDSVRVGLNPSVSTGLVDVLSDPDKNGVFKITSRDQQKFVLEARQGATVVRKEWSLEDLEFREPLEDSVTFSATGLEIKDDIDWNNLSDSPTFRGEISGTAGTYTLNLLTAYTRYFGSNYSNIKIYHDNVTAVIKSANISPRSTTVTGVTFNTDYHKIKVEVLDEYNHLIFTCVYDSNFT